jgi:cytoplasmic tRNA 2-thiolation protein 1
VRPSAILDVVRSGEDMAKLVPGNDDDAACAGACGTTSAVPQAVPLAEEEEGGCGSSNSAVGGEMERMERQLASNEHALENNLEIEITATSLPLRQKKGKKYKTDSVAAPQRKTQKQVMGQCSRCGYLSSQEVCKACVLLEGLNKSRPKNQIEVAVEVEVESPEHVMGRCESGL